MTRNKGFSIVEVVIVLAVVGLIGLIGWRVWDATQNTNNASDMPATTETETVQPVNSEQDLDTVDKQLDGTNVEGNESQQLDSQTSF